MPPNPPPLPPPRPLSFKTSYKLKKFSKLHLFQKNAKKPTEHWQILIEVVKFQIEAINKSLHPRTALRKGQTFSVIAY